MRTVTALFDRYGDAARAVKALQEGGIAGEEISVLASRTGRELDAVDADTAAEGAGAGAGIGAVLGGAGGLLAGLGALAIPGIGPVIAGGWLVSTAIGAVTGAALGGAAGGIMGALIEAGVPEEEAHAYAEGVRRGGTLVSVRTNEEKARLADAVLHDAGTVDMDDRRRAFEHSGWDRFDSEADPYSSEEVQDWRDNYLARVPPVL